MSIFSGQFNPLPWLQEKTLHALQAAAQLVDLANEPDTTAWYKRNLLHIAELLIDRLAPVVAFLNKADKDAAEREEWGTVLEGGTFALATWCRKWKIGDPTLVAKGSLLHLRTVDDQNEKDEDLFPEQSESDITEALDLKLQIYAFMTRRLVHDNLSPAAQKLLLWMLSSLWLNDPPDVVTISRRFLPTDIGISREDANMAYKELYEQGLIERVEPKEPNQPNDRLSLRLVIQGVNDSRHAAPYQHEEFGYPGARIAGNLTLGQTTCIELPKTLAATSARWFREQQDLTQLRDALQSNMGEDRIYIETAVFDNANDQPVLVVNLRYPIDSDLESLEHEASVFAQQWLANRLVRLSSDNG